MENFAHNLKMHIWAEYVQSIAQYVRDKVAPLVTIAVSAIL